MSSPDQQADGGSRRAATDLVERALAAGRIVRADRDVRVDQISSARTMQDLDLIVRDLRAADQASVAAPALSVASVGAPPAVPPGAPGQAWPQVSYGPAQGSGEVARIATVDAGRVGRVVGGVIGVVVLLAVVLPVLGAIIAFSSSRDSFPDFDDPGPSDDSTYLPGQAPGEDGVNLFTVEGFEAMSSALVDATGQKYVYMASIYPRYAVLEVPTGTNARYENWYWDGASLERQDYRSSSTNEQIDLTLLEPQTVIDLVEDACTRIEDPDSWYASVSDYEMTETQVMASCSNDFDESAYLVATLDGTITYDSTAQD